MKTGNRTATGYAMTSRRVVWIALFLSAVVTGWGADPVSTNAPAAPAPKQERQGWVDMMTIDLTRPVVVLAPPADAAARRAAFAHRNDPAQIEALAKALFALWDMGEKKTSRLDITRRLEPLKADAVKRFQAKDYPGALDVFRAYFLAKLRLVYTDEKGLVSTGYESRFSQGYVTRNYEDTVAQLMDHVWQVPETKETVRIGEPGEVRWDFLRTGPLLWQNSRSSEFEYFSMGNSPFNRLWWKFTDTRDPKYLEKYLAFLDDYTMNQPLQADLSAGNLDLGKQGAADASAYLYSLSEIARCLPSDGAGYSSASLARMIVRLMTLQIPQSLYYNREQSNNHSCGDTHEELRLSHFLYDFSFARTMELHARRQFESYGTLFDMADGAMPGKNLGYAFHELRENLIFLNNVKAFGYDWFTPQLYREYTDRLLRRAFYVMNLYNASGESVQVYKGDRRNGPFDTTITAWLNQNLPQTGNDPAILAISDRIIHNQLAADWRGQVYMPRNRPVAREGLGVAEGAVPLYTSISFPYTGTHIMRSGWNPATAHYGVFVESRARGDDGGLFHEAKCCNTLQIGAFGQDIFINGVDFVYNFVPSPVLVDRLSQFSLNGKSTHSRKGDNNEGLRGLTPYRIHHSDRFDVVEGLYDGAWADTLDHDPPLYDWKYRLEVQKRAVSGVTHRRVVQFVKQHGLWIVLDIMRDVGAGPSTTNTRSAVRHTYTQQFFLSRRCDHMPDGYLESQFAVDPKALTLKSSAPGKVNVAMYFAGPAAAQLELLPVVRKTEVLDAYTLQRSDRKNDKEFLHLRSRWGARGESLLVTVLQATGPAGEGDPITEFTRSTDGFTAKLASGAMARFSARLAAGANTPAGCESQLAITEVDGSENGLTLGADSHEFSSPGPSTPDPRPSTLPIVPPIRDLVISPERNVFVDSLAVSVTCPDPEVEIHYTLDGGDPTLGAPPYTGPVKLTGSAMFKACGFRKGLAAMPADRTSGTLMSRVFTAVFTREEPLPADTVAEMKLKTGLKFSYYQGKWPYLLFGAPTLPPVKSGVVTNLFDTTANTGHKGAFGFSYEGYLRVPEDGVYTLHAPDEFMKFRPLAGYDLNVCLGRQVTYANGVPRTGAALNEWYPATRRHAFGTWSVALKKGLHPIRVYYADIRPGAVLEYMQFTYPGLNVPGLSKTFWDGVTPELWVSGPALDRRPLPAAWLSHP